MIIDPLQSPAALLASIARSQLGLVTRRQALDAGLTKDAVLHRMRTGQFEVVARNVYRIAGAPASWEQRLLAALLSIGPPAVVSHRPAAILQGLLPRSEVIELSIPNTRKVVTPPEWIIHRVGGLAKHEVVQKGAIVLTDPHRTMMDLAGVVSRDVLESALDVGHQRRVVGMARLQFLLHTNRKRGRRGLGTLSELVEERHHDGKWLDSMIEVRLLKLLKRWRFPLPQAQYPVRLGNGVTVHIDLAYPERKLAIECDGFGPHGQKKAFNRDRERDRYLLVEGWRTPRVTWDDVTIKQDELREVMRRLLLDRTLEA